MADEKIEGVGAPLAADVVAQIDTRKASIGKLSNRSNEDLLYQNGNTAWVRLSSSVNTLTQAEIDSLTIQQGRTTITGDSRLSGYNILQGGVLAPDRTLRQGIDFTGNDNQYAAYNNRTRSTGFRPMPGITSLSVQSKNTYGTLREADVKFSVWSLEDFETMEQIYLRPGFTMLLEWGHSVYYGNDGKLSTNIETIPNKFFQSGIRMSTLLKWISDFRKKSSYNYEAMIGYCKNFSWSYKANGEYECSVSIISTGEILESLTAKIDPQLKGVPKAEMVEDDSEKAKDLKKSPIHYFVSKLEKVTETPWTRDHFATQAPTMGTKLEPFTGYYLDVEYIAAGSWWSDNTPTHWIPLSTFFDICTKYLSTVDNTKPENSPDRYYVVFNTDRAKSSKFLTHPNHFSVDPTVCVLPRESQTGLGRINAIHQYLGTPPEGGYDNVLNILVSTLYLKKVFNDALDDLQGFKKPLAEIIEEILSAINTSLGGINDLSLSYDEEAGRGTFYLVDRNNTNYPAVPELTLAGSNSIFTEINMSSKISNEMASQIAIAAQGSLQDQHDNVENILKWNPGIIDRIHVTKDVSVTSSNNLEELRQRTVERTAQWETDVKLFFGLFNNTQVGWKDSQLQAAKTLHAERNVQWLKDAVTTSKSPMPGIVPVELSFKLDGIGGLKIGNCFKIAAGILPSKYQGKFGYIITGLEHSIGANNRWETSVKAQFYNVDATNPDAALNANVKSLDENIKNSSEGNLSPEDFGIIQIPTGPPPALITAMKAYGITSPLERAHFLSQCAHESLSFRVTTEYASGEAYEGRVKGLGNTQKGDGKKYKGRGYIQITGRANYTSYNKYLLSKGIKDDVLKNPNLVAIKFAADSACWWWKFVNPGLPKIALGGSTPAIVERVTKVINGGTNGLLDRQGKFNGYWATLQKNPQAYT